MNAGEKSYVVVKQRAGCLEKVMVTDNYRYLRLYGPEATRRRCGPALSRTSVDKLELRLALFEYDGVFWTLTFDDAHLPASRAEAVKAWKAFMRKLRRCRGSPVDYYVYRIEGLHGDKRWHIHAFLRGSDFTAEEVAWAWSGRGNIKAEVWTRERVLERRDYDPDFVAGYRGLARYFTKEVPEVGRHPWGCSHALGTHIPRPRIGASVSGAVRPPPGAALLPADDVPKLTGWGVFGYCRYLVAGS